MGIMNGIFILWFRVVKYFARINIPVEWLKEVFLDSDGVKKFEFTNIISDLKVL